MNYSLLLAGLAAAVGAIWLRANLEAVTLFEYERGLKYARGRFDGVLSPGRYQFYRPTTVIRRIDIRPTLVPVNRQEVLSADDVAVKVSLAATFQISDPAQAINGGSNRGIPWCWECLRARVQFRCGQSMQPR